MRSSLSTLFLVAGSLFTMAAASAAPTPPRQHPGVSQVLGRVPLTFERNDGQAEARVRYLSRGPGYTLALAPDEAVLALRAARRGEAGTNAASVLRLRCRGANTSPRIEALEPQATRSSYFLGKDASRWRTGVPHFGKVRYADVYPGIDLVYYGNQRQLEFDFVVDPGADPGRIDLEFAGADGLEIDAEGDLLVHVGRSTIRQRRPVAYQEAAGLRTAVEAAYSLAGANRASFRIGSYDHRQALILDPVLVYSTYFGGSDDDFAGGVATDGSGNAYIVGTTYSARTTTPEAFQPALAGAPDVFVAKLNASGTAIVYWTYLGGTGADYASAVAVDLTGDAYVTGFTDSTDFPVTSGAAAGASDAFVTKLTPDGSALTYSTYLGGSEGYGIALDPAGNAYVAGVALSGFPTVSPIKVCASDYTDAFVSRINAAGSALVYSTCLGGSDEDAAESLAVDGAGNAYLAGYTYSSNFPTVGAIRSVRAGTVDAFVSKLDAAGSGLVYSTYLGGSASEDATAIAVDAAGNAYVAGMTTSTDFPTVRALQATYGGGTDAFVARLNAAGSALVYSTYLGGTDLDQPAWSLAVDGSRNVYVTGDTDSTDFPSVRAVQKANAGGADVFLTKIQGAWHEWFAVDTLETPYVGDFNGDGKTDIITFTRQNPNAVGDVYVALSNGRLFVDKNGNPDSSDKWHDWFAITTDETVVIGDYDGDGKDDIATWLGTTTRQAYVALSYGTGMSHETVWADSIGFDPSDVLLAGDVDGDAKDDLVCFARKQGKVYVALSTGTSFGSPQQWHSWFAVSTYERPRVADVNGDGKADIVTFATNSPTAQGDVYVALSNGKAFVDQNGIPNSSTKWHDWFAVQPSEQVRIGNIDGDTKQDFFTFLPPPFAQCYTVRSEGTQMGPNVLWPEPVAPNATDVPYVGDVNGDGKADVIVFAQAEGKVHVSLGQ